MQYGSGMGLAAHRASLDKAVAKAKRASRAGGKWLQKHPLVAKALPTAWGFAFGDILTQHFNNPRDRHGCYTHEFDKTAGMAIVGGTMAAPIGLVLYRWMDAVWPGSGVLLAAGKFTLDQVIGCVVWQSAYLSLSPMYRGMLGGYLDDRQISIPLLRPLPAAAA